MRQLSILIFSLFCFNSVSANAGEAAIVKLDENLFVVEGGGGKGSNVGVLITDSGMVLVDSMVTESKEYLLTQLKSISSKPVRYLLATHDHFDHIGNAPHFLGEGASLVGGSRFEPDSQLEFLSVKGVFGLEFGGAEVKGYTINSHSPSDVLYYLPNQNVIFLGDVYTDGWYPSFFSGGIGGQVQAIELALALGDAKTRFVPGHGQVASAQQLRQYLEHTTHWAKRIMQLHARGESPQQMLGDAELVSIKASFANDRTNMTFFDERFVYLVKHTIEAEEALRNAAEASD